MTASWDDYAGEWESNEAVVFYSQGAYQSLMEELSCSKVRIFDFGCGTGLLTEKLAPMAESIVALDVSTKMIDVLKKKNLANVATISVELSQQLIASHPLLTVKFDLVVASSALAFVDDYRNTVDDLKTLLNPGGHFVQWDWLKGDDSEGIGFSDREVRDTLEASGFVDVKINYPFSIKHDNQTLKVLMGVGTNP